MQSHNAATCGFCNFVRGKNSRTLYENSRTFFENSQTFTIFPEKLRNTKNFRTLQGILESMTTLRVLTRNFGKMTVSGIWEKSMCVIAWSMWETHPQCIHGVLGDPGTVGTKGKVSNYLKVFKVWKCQILDCSMPGKYSKISQLLLRKQPQKIVDRKKNFVILKTG